MSDPVSADVAGLFEAAADEAVSSDVRDEATRLVSELAAAEFRIAKLEKQLEGMKEEYRVLREHKVPEAMIKANQSQFRVALGDYANVSVEIADFVSGSLPKDETERGMAIEYLEENDAAELIKDTISISFRKSEHNMALDLLGRLKQEGFECVFENTVHHSTLQAWARERLRKGEPIDPEVLGLHVGRYAKLTWPPNTIPTVKKRK